MNDLIRFAVRGAGPAAGLCLVLAGLAGCGREPADHPTAANTAPAAPPPVSEPVMLHPDGTATPSAAETAMLQALLGEAREEGEPQTEADKAWRDLRQSLDAPPIPAEWRTNPPTEAELGQFKQRTGEFALQAADRAKDFYTRFADHPRANQARDQEMELLTTAVFTGQSNALARLETLEAARLQDPALDDEDRLWLRVHQLQRNLALHENATHALPRFEQGVRALQKEYPQQPELAGLLLAAAEGWMEHDPAKARSLAREVSEGAADDELKEAAQGLLGRLARLGQPLALQFTAIDGRAVDLQQMKGKVVLVDFWATWCRPCMVELPNVKAAYEKLHGQGFEILGLSLDHEKSALQRVVEREKIPWPQQFDDRSDGNKFAEEFGITAIPTMWLVDKKGLLRDLNARENLAAKVEKLLAEK